MQDDSQTESSQNQDDELSQMPIEAAGHSQLGSAMDSHGYHQAVMAQSHPMSITFSPKRIKEPGFGEQPGHAGSQVSSNLVRHSQQEISPSQLQISFKSPAQISPCHMKSLGPESQSDRELLKGQEESRRAAQAPPARNVELCPTHGDEIILQCLKDSEKICARCLNSTHLLHPVVPVGSLDQLDFQKSLQQELENSLKEIKEREPVLKETICGSLRRHKINLRNHIIFIRDNLREEFDDFFNKLLQSVRKDWNLFNVQEQLIRQTHKFNQAIAKSLKQITEQALMTVPKTDLKRCYEQLQEAQEQVQTRLEDWKAYEKNVQSLMGCLRQHSAFDVIDGEGLKTFMSESLVMNYSNIELNRVVQQQNVFDGAAEQQNLAALGQSASAMQRAPRNHSPRQPDSPSFHFAGRTNHRQSVADRHNFDPRENARQQRNRRFSRDRSGNSFDMGADAHLNFNEGRQRPSHAVPTHAANELMASPAHQQQMTLHRAQSHVGGRGPFDQQARQAQQARIHFFKFDQRTIHYYNVDIDKKQRETLNINFNIPIRFCSIQTSDGKIFITGGAKNSNQSSNHAYELRDNELVQLPNMKNPREGHCLAAIGSRLIYAIGSRLYNTSKTCESYSVADNQWHEQPELNRNRYLSTAVTIQDRYIYVLGGYEPSVTDIERLDTEASDRHGYWELIKVWSQSFENDIKYWFGACPVSQSEILIFGGKKDGTSSASSYLFDTQLNQISKTGNMPNKDTFYQRTFLCKNGKVYAYGYENDSAYIYSIQSQSWTKKVPN